MKGTGNLYPGMSGGPVIDQTTGKIIGVNHAVDSENILVSDTIELFDNLEVSANY